MKRLLLAFIILSSLTLHNSAAQSESNSGITAKLLVDMGIEYGGDELLTVFFTNGQDQTMLAGQGAYLAAGGQLDFGKSVMLRMSIGIKYNTTAADNANIRLTRLPINIIPYWKINEDFRLGVGLTTHQSVRLKGDGFLDDEDFKSTTGARVEFGYKWAALTYTSVKYEAQNGEQLDAGSLGLSISFTLPK